MTGRAPDEPIESRFDVLDESGASGRRVIAEGEHSRGDRRVAFAFRLDPAGKTTMLEIEQKFVLEDDVVHEEVDSLAIEDGTVPHLDESPTAFAESAFHHNPELLLGRLFDQALADDDHPGVPHE